MEDLRIKNTSKGRKLSNSNPLLTSQKLRELQIQIWCNNTNEFHSNWLLKLSEIKVSFPTYLPLHEEKKLKEFKSTPRIDGFRNMERLVSFLNLIIRSVFQDSAMNPSEILTLETKIILFIDEVKSCSQVLRAQKGDSSHHPFLDDDQTRFFYLCIN